MICFHLDGLGSTFKCFSQLSFAFPDFATLGKKDLMWATPIVTKSCAEMLTSSSSPPSICYALKTSIAFILVTFLLGAGPTMVPVPGVQEDYQGTFLFMVFPWELGLGLGMFVYLVRFMAPAAVSSISAWIAWSASTLLVWALHCLLSLPCFGIGIFPIPFLTMVGGCLGLAVAFAALAAAVPDEDVPKEKFRAGKATSEGGGDERAKEATNTPRPALLATLCLMISAVLGLLWLGLTLYASDTPYSLLTPLLYETLRYSSRLYLFAPCAAAATPSLWPQASASVDFFFALFHTTVLETASGPAIFALAACKVAGVAWR